MVYVPSHSGSQLGSVVDLITTMPDVIVRYHAILSDFMVMRDVA